MDSVEVAVVGLGMIGAAAARHLAESGVSTALVGPGEPVDRTTATGPFCSHCDEGRITRIAARTTTWAHLAVRSIARYSDIERRSGISFHQRTGLVMAMADVDDWIDSGLIAGANVRSIQTDEVERSTGICLTNGHPAAYEGPPAGHINPRRMVAAQSQLTEAAGGTVVTEEVTGIERNNGGFELSGPWGTIRAARVLIATGAFGRNLLDRELDLERGPRTVLLAEYAEAMTLPSLIVGDPPDDRLSAVYWVPPVPFPDGKTYLKIGGNLRTDPVIDDDAELVDWFHTDGDPTEIEALDATLRSLLPGPTIVSTTSTPCVVTATPTGHPYLGWVEDGIAVAIGGNGSAAKSSDELGRLAATLFSNDGWTDSLDHEQFEPRFR